MDFLPKLRDACVSWKREVHLPLLSQNLLSHTVGIGPTPLPASYPFLVQNSLQLLLFIQHTRNSNPASKSLSSFSHDKKVELTEPRREMELWLLGFSYFSSTVSLLLFHICCLSSTPWSLLAASPTLLTLIIYVLHFHFSVGFFRDISNFVAFSSSSYLLWQDSFIKISSTGLEDIARWLRVLAVYTWRPKFGRLQLQPSQPLHSEHFFLLADLPWNSGSQPVACNPSGKALQKNIYNTIHSSSEITVMK